MESSLYSNNFMSQTAVLMCQVVTGVPSDPIDLSDPISHSSGKHKNRTGLL